jgi:hypothetical protein
MVGMKVTFTLKDRPPVAGMKQLLGELVRVYGQVEGLKQKYFIEDPERGESGGIYIFESEEALEKYLGSDVWVNVVEANAKAQPVIERFLVVAALDLGVLI